MKTSTAKAVVRDLARQDIALGDEDGSDLYPTKGAAAAVQGWRDAGANAGDTGVVEAIDALGIAAAALEYQAERKHRAASTVRKPRASESYAARAARGLRPITVGLPEETIALLDRLGERRDETRRETLAAALALLARA